MSPVRVAAFGFRALPMFRVLLTSFEPFGGFTGNSSFEAGRVVATMPLPGVEVCWRVLPVVAGACVERAWAAVEELWPDVVLALGQAAGTATLRVEKQAFNLDDFSLPDNAGNHHRKRPIIPGGPATYQATLCPVRTVRGLRGVGHAAVVSSSAGAYVCNHLFYTLLHRAAVAGCSHPTGFLHLPLLPGQVDPRRPLPAWPLDALADGVQQAIHACLHPMTEPASAVGH
jgi:pyroglutamyl-peptidase